MHADTWTTDWKSPADVSHEFEFPAAALVQKAHEDELFAASKRIFLSPVMFVAYLIVLMKSKFVF